MRKPEGKGMVLDIQGSGYTLCDPEITSTEIQLGWKSDLVILPESSMQLLLERP